MEKDSVDGEKLEPQEPILYMRSKSNSLMPSDIHENTR